MEAISKQHVIELLNKIQVTGLDNSRYSVDEFKSPVIAEKWYGKTTGRTKIQPGTYCALWFDEADCTDEPLISYWIDNALTVENFEYLFGDDGGCIILICLDLL